ncbi:DUF6531 domain-containing protein, partial [Neisseriaceae bacterium TC5R-5]|nr:DUF6531 domain-containing protein [Neisseriaceae bacterium TC5R-5]
MYEAARLHDPIEHSSALAGFLIGAVIGIALIIAAAVCFLPPGIGCFVAGLVAGLAAPMIATAGEAIGRMFTSTAGMIDSGSPDVFINSRAAAHVEKSAVLCDKHAPVKRMAEGSSNTFINSQAAVRKDDRTECDAKVGGGSDNVFIGGGRVAYLPIEPEIPEWVRTAVDWAFAAAGLVGGLAGMARMAAKQGLKVGAKCAAKYAAGVIGGELFSRYAVAPILGGLLGNPVDVTTGRKVLLAQDEMDFSLPARLPITCARFYASDLDDSSLLGRGWRLDWEMRLQKTADGLMYYGPQGRGIPFPLLTPGNQLYDASEQITLSCLRDGRYVLHTLSQHYYVFGPFDASGLARMVLIEAGPDKQRIGFHWQGERLLKIVAPGNCRLDLHYHEHGPLRLSHINLSSGGTRSTLVAYGYDEQHQLSSVTHRNGVVQRRFSYQHGLMSSHSNALGWHSHYRWQTLAGQPRVVEHWNDDGEHYHLNYDLTERRTRVRNVFGHHAEWQYDSEQQVTAHTAFDGSTYRFEYNESGWPTTLHLPGKRTVKLDYDVLGRPIVETDPLGQTTRTDYHASTDQISRITLHDQRTWQQRYDEHHRLIEQKDPLGRATRYRYDDKGLLSQITDPRGGIVTLAHNERGQLTTRTDCSGKTEHYHYNADGQLTRLTDPLEQSTRLDYNAAGQISSVTRPDMRRERYQWDALGQLSAYTSAAGHTQQWQRDARGRIQQHRDAEGRTTGYQYDQHGRLIRLTNPNQASYHFSWDAGNRLSEEQRLDGQRRQFHYDAAGFLNTLTHISRTTTQRQEQHQRDALGRLIAKSTAHSHSRYQYNLLGQLTQAEREPTIAGLGLGIQYDKVSFDYDQAGQLIAEHNAHGSLSYQLDALGNASSLTLPQDSVLHTLHYGSGHVHQIRFGDSVIADFERDDLHREILRSQGKLQQHSHYNKLGQLDWQGQRLQNHDKEPDTLWRRYHYGHDDELLHNEDRHGQTHYQYDRNGQLLRRTHDMLDIERFSYDPAGNLIDPDLPMGSKLLDNLLRQYMDTQYDYDEWGQLTRKYQNGQELRLHWDDEGHLIKVENAGKHTAYQYDALGRRIAKFRVSIAGQMQVSGPGVAAPQTNFAKNEIRFLWQGMRLLQEQTDEVIKTYVY